jgi:activator of HSP90 ATPase
MCMIFFHHVLTKFCTSRKGKIIPGYEIAIQLSWKGEARDGSGTPLALVTGTVELPYVADENADEEPELNVSVKEDSPAAQRMREAFRAKGRPMVQSKIAQFVKEMAVGGPAKDELEKRATAAKAAPEKTGTKPSAGTESIKIQAPAPKPKVKEGFKTITVTEKFYCRPRDLYEILLDENRWKGFTQSAAKISKEVGGSFSIFDGAVTGINLQLQENKLIMQKWRFSNWADGQYSNVRSYNIFQVLVIVSYCMFHP